MNTFWPWLMTALATCAALGIGLGWISVLLFRTAREGRQCRTDLAMAQQETAEIIRELRSKMEEVAARSMPAAAAESATVPQSLNLTRRARALHMRRRGEQPYTIAAALSASQGEVDLLLKLDRLVHESGARTAARPETQEAGNVFNRLFEATSRSSQDCESS